MSGKVEQPLGSTLSDTSGEGGRSDRIAKFLEELHRNTIGDAPTAATEGEIASLTLEINMAVLHAQLDAQGRIARFEGGEALHQPKATDGRDRGETHDRCTARFHPAIRPVGNDRQSLGRTQKQSLTLGRQGHAAGLAIEKTVTEPALEFGDLAAYRPMGKVQGFSGSGEAAGASGRVKSADRVERRQNW